MGRNAGGAEGGVVTVGTDDTGTGTAGPENRDGPSFGARLIAQDDSDVVAAIRDANRQQRPLRIAGGGTWSLGGHVVRATSTLDVSGLSGISEYVPGDLTLTARGGTTLAEIAEATRKNGQWLGLDPPGGGAATLGATLATASTGPLAASVGLPRDVTVGLTVVSGDGRVVHGGGRVVKNVAGFDLVRLMIGAWGTLGVVVSATVRLRARPEVDETLILPMPGESADLGAFIAAIRDAHIEPLAEELLSATLAAKLGLGEHPLVLVRLAGNRIAVAHQRDRLERLAAVQEAPDECWQGLRESDPAAGCIVRVSRRPSELTRLWTVATAIPGADVQATLSRGIVRIRWEGSPPPDALAGFDATDVRVLDQRPAEGALPFPPPSPDDLSRRMRLAFDPHGILNPGIMGEVAT